MPIDRGAIVDAVIVGEEDEYVYVFHRLTASWVYVCYLNGEVLSVRGIPRWRWPAIGPDLFGAWIPQPDGSWRRVDE